MSRSSELLLRNLPLKGIWGAKKEWLWNVFKISDAFVEEDIEWVFLFVDNELELMRVHAEELEKPLQEERNNFLRLLLPSGNLLNLFLNKAQPNGYNL